jgi:hypothetical protein
MFHPTPADIAAYNERRAQAARHGVDVPDLYDDDGPPDRRDDPTQWLQDLADDVATAELEDVLALANAPAPKAQSAEDVIDESNAWLPKKGSH